jgi:cytoskeletal protein CcmA (bactofilin family)
MFQKQITMFHKKSPTRPGSSAASIAGVDAADRRRVSTVPSVVSADMTIRGDLLGAGDLQIEGKVFGRIHVGHLVIAETGEVEGDIVAKAVGIFGALRGSIRAGSVTLSATAKVQGDILHDVLAIEAGAQLEGQCKRLSVTQIDKLLSPPPDEAAGEAAA